MPFVDWENLEERLCALKNARMHQLMVEEYQEGVMGYARRHLENSLEALKVARNQLRR